MDCLRANGGGVEMNDREKKSEKNIFETFSDKINAFPRKALHDTVRRCLGTSINEFDLQVAQLSFPTLNAFEKIQNAITIMGILEEGHIELRLFDIGYSIEHVFLILNDLNKCYNAITLNPKTALTFFKKVFPSEARL